jgi:hypothetical protein
MLICNIEKKTKVLILKSWNGGIEVLGYWGNGEWSEEKNFAWNLKGTLNKCANKLKKR